MTGWLEPLLARISENRSRVVMPIVDEINPDTMAYRPVADPLPKGGFNWLFQFRWDEQVPNVTRSNVDPIRSPTMPGGIFAMDRLFFLTLGGYSVDATSHAGNLEHSLKVWMCGGSVEIIPCSRVAHIHGNASRYSVLGKRPSDANARTTMRVVEAWADDYKVHFYNRLPHLKGQDYGDVSEQSSLRNSLKCNSFAWYLTNVYKEMYVPDMRTMQKYSAAISSRTGLCLDSTDQNGLVGLAVLDCHGRGGNQYFELTSEGQLRNDGLCLQPDDNLQYVHLRRCATSVNALDRQRWQYKGTRLGYANSSLCLQLAKSLKGNEIQLANCSGSDDTQTWTFT